MLITRSTGFTGSWRTVGWSLATADLLPRIPIETRASPRWRLKGSAWLSVEGPSMRELAEWLVMEERFYQLSLASKLNVDYRRGKKIH